MIGPHFLFPVSARVPRVRPCSPWFFSVKPEEPRGTRADTGGHGGNRRSLFGRLGIFDSSHPLNSSRHAKKRDVSSTVELGRAHSSRSETELDCDPIDHHPTSGLRGVRPSGFMPRVV